MLDRRAQDLGRAVTAKIGNPYYNPVLGNRQAFSGSSTEGATGSVQNRRRSLRRSGPREIEGRGADVIQLPTDKRDSLTCRPLDWWEPKANI